MYTYQICRKLEYELNMYIWMNEGDNYDGYNLTFVNTYTFVHVYTRAHIHI